MTEVHHRSRRSCAAITAVALVTLAACSDPAAPPKTATVTSPKPTVTKPQPEPTLRFVRSPDPAEREVAEAYRASVIAYLDTSAQPNPDAPVLARTHVGPMLEAIRTREKELADKGQAVRLPSPSQFVIRVDAIAITGATAALTVCEVDDGIVFRSIDGRTVDGAVVSQRRRATMRRMGDRWRLEGRKSDAKHPGNSACNA